VISLSSTQSTLTSRAAERTRSFAQQDLATKEKIQQAGGARGDCDSESSATGESERKSVVRASTFRATVAAIRGCGSADRDVVTARQQS